MISRDSNYTMRYTVIDRLTDKDDLHRVIFWAANVVVYTVLSVTREDGDVFFEVEHVVNSQHRDCSGLVHFGL